MDTRTPPTHPLIVIVRHTLFCPVPKNQDTLYFHKRAPTPPRSPPFPCPSPLLPLSRLLVHTHEICNLSGRGFTGRTGVTAESDKSVRNSSKYIAFSHAHPHTHHMPREATAAVVERKNTRHKTHTRQSVYELRVPFSLLPF